ncbi:uncharacterized protein LOC134225154 [Armigeres subalbatus]|uniref:uncharacterized protein LOC134225154 n=1 Tax=Armigeres subalbatus TaxID=124917 RepID=UPI002ED078AC
MTKLVQQPSSSSGAADQPFPEVSEPCGDDHSQSSQTSSTSSKGATMPTSKQRPPQQHQPPSFRRTSTRLTSIRNDSLSSSSSSASSSSSSSLSSAADLESGPDIKLPASEDCFKVPSTTPGTPSCEDQHESGVVCRLPLDRLQAILGALNILKSPAESESGTSTSPSPTYKLLCLYCDRTFASQTLMAKHTDRVHRIPKDRRSSSRVVPAVNDGAFPNCSYCSKGKILNLASEDLSQLFKHLVDQHSDRYFACERCALRFPSDESRDAHMESLHQPATSTPETRTRPKSKAALKSFNLNKTKNCDIITTPLTIQVDFDTEAIKNLTIENIEEVDSLSAVLGMVNNSSNRLRSSGRTSARSVTAPSGSSKSKVLKKSDKMLMRTTEPTLYRLGIAQHRTARQGRRGASTKNRRKAPADSASCSSSLSGTSSSQPDNHYNKITKLKTIRSTLNNPSGTSETDFVVSRGGKNDIVSTYDDDFYENVNANVRQNLSCHLDGKLEASTPNAPSPMSPITSAPAIRSIVVKSPQEAESKIHEATNLPAMTVFPTLLTIEQFGTDLLPLTKIKKPITKNSWKWKWDFVKKYKYVNENGKIVKKVKQPVLGQRDLSKLDMWTQLTMRTKHELIRNCRNICNPSSYISDVGDSLRQEQRKQVDELNRILDSRLLPQINLEQHDQSIIKLEAELSEEGEEYSDQYLLENQHSNTIDEEFISTLQLLRLADSSNRKQVVLSGEWARPRCYICYCCGDKFNSLKQMEEHKTFRHPYVYSTYYEIVGRELIEKQLFKHFFIPLSALTMHRIHYSRLSSYLPTFERRFPPIRQPSSESTATITEIKSEDSSSNEATSFSTTTSSSSILSISANTATSSGSSMSSRSALDALLSAGNDYTTSFTNYPAESLPVRCSKCDKECVNTLVLYAHILNCTNDYIWLQAKKRMKYRRANRRRKGCNRAALAARKAQISQAAAVEKSETASNHSGGDADSSSSGSTAGSDAKKKSKSSPPRPKENDSDIVRRLTANLPAKRISRQILQVPKQIRKRPQISIVKGGKKQVASMAPSKAGVPRGASAIALSKLRSGKIAAVSSSSKKLPIKVKPKPKIVVKEEEGIQTEGTVGDEDKNVKEEKNTDTKDGLEKELERVGEKKEDKSEKQKGPVVKKTKKLVPHARKLPVRGNAFANRIMPWKSPFRAGAASKKLPKKVKTKPKTVVEEKQEIQAEGTENKNVKEEENADAVDGLEKELEQVAETKEDKSEEQKIPEVKKTKNMVVSRGRKLPVRGNAFADRLMPWKGPFRVGASSKKPPKKVKTLPNTGVQKEGGTQAEGTVSGGNKNVKEEQNTDAIDGLEEKSEPAKEKNENKSDEQHIPVVKKTKKVVIPRGRKLPVPWKGPFRKGASGNSRTLRSGIVKVTPSGGARKVKAKMDTPIKKKSIKEECKVKKPESSVSEKVSSPKRKGSKSPKEVTVEKAKGKVIEKKIDQKVEVDGKVSEESNHKQKQTDEKDRDKTNVKINGKENSVDEEVPTESSTNRSSHVVEQESPAQNATKIEETTPLKESESNKYKEHSAKATEETPDQPIMSQPVTPVKSPSQCSQPPSAPTTPSCASNHQANKRKPKKLNDCIAMLTSKLSEKIGVDFFNQAIAKNVGPKTTAPSVETRASKQLLLPTSNMLPLHPPTITAMPLQINPPQLAPLPLVMNTRRSSSSSQPPPMLSPVSPIVTPMEEISDEPLNLSKNSPIGRSIPPRSRDVFQKPTHNMSPPPQSPTALHSPHQHPGSIRHPSPQPPHQQQQPGPSTPNRNLPSIKLPPGLIIERVEYKSRPVISKEAPSVTIVARRQPPPSMEGRSTMQPVTIETPPSPQPPSRRQSIHQQPHHQQHQQQLYGDPRKITAPTHQQQQQLPSPKQTQAPSPQQQHQLPLFPLQSAHQPTSTPSIASTLRQERPLENRISVTITEAKSPVAKQPPVTLNIPERLPVIDRTPPTAVNPSPLIIPSVPIPVQTQSSGSGSSKRSRRKSVYVAPNPISESPTPAPVPQIPQVVPPAPVVAPPFLPGPFPLFPHSLLAGPPLGLDLQRLAAVGLPPHLKPPAIPPLTVPAAPATAAAVSTPAAAAAAAFLEKIFLPNRDVIVKQIENAAAAAAAAAQSSPPARISPSKTSSDSNTAVREKPKIQPTLEKEQTIITPCATPPAATVPVEKKSRSRAKSSKAKAQSVIVPPTVTTKEVVPSPEVIEPPPHPAETTEAKSSIPTEASVSTPTLESNVESTVATPPEKQSNRKKTPPRYEPAPKTTEISVEKTIPLESPAESQTDPKPLDTDLESKDPPKCSSTPPPTTANSGKIVRKRRKNELAAILSDQLLESFKEVDQNALQDLKMMHDMSCEKPDIKFSLEQIPQLAKRKVNIRHPDLLARQSPVIGGKKTPAKKGVAKDQSVKEHMTDEDQEIVKAGNEEEEKDTPGIETEFVDEQPLLEDTDKVGQSIVPVVEDVQMSTSKKTAQKKTQEKTFTATQDEPSDTKDIPQEMPSVPPPQVIKKAPPNRRTRKLSIDIERIAGLDRKGRQNMKSKYSKELEGLDIAERLEVVAPVQKKSKGKANKKQEVTKSSSQESPQIQMAKEDDKMQPSETALEKPVEERSVPETVAQESTASSSRKKSQTKSRSKTPFPFPKEKPTKKTDLDRLKESLNIETPTMKPVMEKKKQEEVVQELSKDSETISMPSEPSSQKKSAKRKSGKGDSEEPVVDPVKVPNKKKKDAAEEPEPGLLQETIMKTPTKRSKTPAPVEETSPKTSAARRSKTPASPLVETPTKSPAKRSKTPAPTEDISAKTTSKRSKTPAPTEVKQRSPSPVATPKKAKTPTPPKRIMQRRSSVFVDRNLAQYLEERDAEQELLSHSSFKDDLILTSRRGTRSQGTVDLDLVQSFAEAAMKPRDPRRRSAAAVAAAAASAKRAEEERKVADEERKRIEAEKRRVWEEEKRKYEEAEENKKVAEAAVRPTAPLRRISARRASLFIASPPEIEEPKAPEENIAEISKATKRQYRRRASVYQPMSFLDEEEQMEKQTAEEKKTKTPLRSKTPGPGGIWDQDIKSVGRRRNQSSVFNGTPEPTIESLLEPLTVPTTGTKRRTKNSQLAENLSKLFNIEEEIQMIDRSKRKPRKSNTPVAFESLTSAPVSSTPIKEIKEDAVAPKVSPIVMEPKKIDELVKVVEKEVAKASIAPKPRESLSFSNDDEDETPKLNKLVEDIINKSESESDSDDDNMSLACFVRREESFLKPSQHQSQESFEGMAEDESNSAMDDDMSVTTEVTSFGGSIRKRKRRKSICVTKCRRPKPPVDDSKPVVTFNCDLCKKVFKKQDAFNKHRMTLSHIAKLSEQEYLEAQQKERDAATAETTTVECPVQHSSPAQIATSVAGSSPPKEFDKDGPMKALSQEEKLFYECCSMLKESNADNENLNLTVSLKSDEMTPGMVCDQVPSAKASVAFPNPFAGLPEQDKATDGCFNMGDSFPSFQDVSESENYIQTINQRYADKNLSDPFTKLTAVGISQHMENDGNLSPQNSTKSTSSQASVFSQKTIKTKGALKGYDNFKVSIPMSGIQVAKESNKLDTLADVALCGDIPKEFDLKDSEEEKEDELSGRIPEVSTSTTPLNQKSAKSEGSPKNGLQGTGKRAPAKKDTQGNKLGFRAKKKGNATPTKATAAAASTSSRRSTARGKKTTNTAVAKTPARNTKPDPDDVYAFQDSPPEEAETLLSYSSKKTSTSTSSPAIVNKSVVDLQTGDQGEDSQLSSLSFSDRDDFVYGTNTLSEEDEDDKSSSYSSSQTTPKKPVKADVQKKSLIMGRIFKKAKDKLKEEPVVKKGTTAAGEQSKPVAKDFDKLFDTLKKSEVEEKPEEKDTSTEADQSSEIMDSQLLDEDEEDEKGNRNLRRRSTQKKLTETWDSDEYEDFNVKNAVNLIAKKDGKSVTNKNPSKEENVLEEKDVSQTENKSDETPLKAMNLSSKEPITTKGKTVGEKKPLVTDETIRQVMESVIMEVTMNKNNRVRDTKRRGKTRPSKTATSDSSREDENLPEKDSSVENIGSLDDHVLESSVMISSRTITTKFKQKLNSTQSGKQKDESKQKLAEQPEKTTQEEPKKSTTPKTVNNNNQKTKVAAKAKEQRKDAPEVKGATNNSKLKQRKGPPKKMKNVAYDPDSDFEDNIKCKKVKKKLLESDIEANLKIEQLNAQLSDSILMPAPRRKRNAAETLYFWSSSSEEDDLEQDFVEVSSNKSGSAAGSKKKKGGGASKAKQPTAQQSKTQQKQQRHQQQQQQQQQQHQQQQQQQKQLDSQSIMEGGDDTSSSSEHMQQHGWIVGDSHKKLVTLLAHAKGKQDNRPVKATGNRRKYRK